MVEPILNKIFDGVMDHRDDEYKAVFEEVTGIERASHEESMMFGLGAAPEMPDGTPVTYQKGGILFDTRHVYKSYGLAYALTQVLVEDGDHINMGSIFARHLAQSGPETVETNCAQILNRAFNASFPGGDGVSLSNSAHPIIGSTFSNILTTAAALSQTSLEQMLIDVRQAVDNTGKKMRLNPMKLVVHPQNVFQAEVLTKSVLRAGTANNDLNPIKSKSLLQSDTAVISRLTSATAWWIKTDAEFGLRVFWRRKFKRSMEGDFETDNMRYKMTFRNAQGYLNPRTVFGTPGV